MELTPRKRRILQIIVQDYIELAEPIGSRTIARRYNLGVSSATVRNEMADLEEMGLLSQPHTSAGRIPSDKGYRVYVDSLMPSQSLSYQEIAWLEQALNQRIVEKETVVTEVARALSQLTNYTALVLGPFIACCKLKRFTLVPITQNQALAVVVTDNGLTASQHIELPESVTTEDLEYMSHIINEEFVGMATVDINPRRIRTVAGRLQKHINRFEYALESLLEQLRQSDQQKVFLGGTTNILYQPEFNDLDRFRELVEALGKQDFVYRLLTESTSGDGITIRIGRENVHSEVRDCSIVTATYQSNGRILGTIGVLGPTRMAYARVVSMLNYVTRRLDEILRG